MPGARVQVDTWTIAPRLYQYTVIDDGTRSVVVAVFPTRSAATTLQFLKQVCEATPFLFSVFRQTEGRSFLPIRFRNCS